MQLIDLDASASINKNEPCGCKLSSAYMPPEMVYFEDPTVYYPPVCGVSTPVAASTSALLPLRAIVRRPNASLSPCSYPLLEARVAYDIWALGCVMYYMSTGETLWQVTNDDNLVDEDLLHLYLLGKWDMDLKLQKLSKIQDPVARNLVSQMLSKNPSLRPDCAHILRHGFITGHVALGRMPGEVAEYDVFISYRVASDLSIAEDIYSALIAAGVRVWMDKHCLQAGELWEAGFCRGLAGSRIFIPLLSREGINNNSVPWQNFSALNALSPCDNVFLEQRLALELKARGMVERVCPVFIGDKATNTPTSTAITGASGDFYTEYLFRDDVILNLVANHPSGSDAVIAAVEEKLLSHLDNLGLGLPLHAETGASVASVLEQLVASQGVFINGVHANTISQVVSDIKQLVDQLPMEMPALPSSPGVHNICLVYHNSVLAERDAALVALEKTLKDKKRLEEENKILLSRLHECGLKI